MNESVQKLYRKVNKKNSSLAHFREDFGFKIDKKLIRVIIRINSHHYYFEYLQLNKN
jgi:hypothetical protein